MFNSSEAKEILEAFTHAGFLSIKKLFSYVFPKEGQELPKITESKWLRWSGYLGPFIAIFLMALVLGWPVFLYYVKGIHHGICYFLGILVFILLLYCLLSMAILLLASLILKIKKRSPLVLLALTAVSPIRTACAIAIISFFGNLFLPNDALMRDEGACRLVKLQYKKEYPGKDYPQDQFWGFAPGHDSYEHVVSILKNAGATFEETGYKQCPHLPVIRIRSYKPFDVLGILKKAELSFDQDGRLFAIDLKRGSEPLPSISDQMNSYFEYSLKPKKENTFIQLRSFFYSKYNPLMKKAWINGEEKEFFTPGNVAIHTSEDCVEIAYVPFEDAVDQSRKQIDEAIKIAKGNQYVKLIE